MDEKISIILPCYNAEATLERYLKSVLAQTYTNIEVIAVDDGSTDHSSAILQKYVPIFQKQHMSMQYLHEDNAGLGAAINFGLQYVTGDYLCWSDPDDFYLPESMEKRLLAFKEHPECAVVSSDAFVFSSDNLMHPIKREAARFEHRYEPKQFEWLLTEKSHFCAGCHMIRMAEFLKVNPERRIYPARRGQNWQLLLPVYYQFPRYYLDEPLYAYISYPGSMSSGDDSKVKTLQRFQEHEDIIRHTLAKIPLTNDEQRKYQKMIRLQYARKRFFAAIDYKDRELLKGQFRLLISMGENSYFYRSLYLRNRYIIWKIFYKLKDRWKECICTKYP